MRSALPQARTGDFSFRSRRGGSTGSSPSAPGRSRTACSRFRNRCRCCLAIPLHPKARRRRTGGSGRVRRCTFRPPGCDVRTGRRVSHHHPQAPSPAFQSIRCSAAAGPDCNRPMWKMLRRQLAGPCSEWRRLQRFSSSAALASILTRSFSEPLRIKLASRPYWFRSRLPLGMHSHGPPKCFRVRFSRATR
jgi:hypothetical protein